MMIFSNFIKNSLNENIEILSKITELIPDAEFDQKSKTRLIIKTDEDRLQVMDKISKKYPDFKRDTSIKGSSIGGLKSGNLVIIVKPKTKVKGGGGRSFENEFASEFAKWCEDSTFKSTYHHLFEEICKENNITPEELRLFSPEPMGKFNQKRTLKDILSNKVDNIGSTVTDITLKKEDGKELFLSLKIGPSFYLYNGGFTKILNSDNDRRTMLASLGADYKQFEKDFQIETTSNFEPEILSGEEFFTNFVRSCIGYGYTMVHENGKNSLVKFIDKSDVSKVKVNINQIRYRSEKSKYFAVDLDITMFGRKYKSQFQLRNNAGKVSPNVIYLLIGKESELSNEEKERLSESNRLLAEEDLLNEGGNVTATNKKTGENTRAAKIPIKEIGRQEFMKKSLELFHKINQLFEKKFKKKLWEKEEHLASGFMFNGSSSFIMDPSLSDEEVIKYKPSAGDFDIAFPEELKEDLWDLLDDLEGEDIIPGVTYVGSNKPSKSSIGDQINCVFVMDFPNGIRAYAQVDFEALPFEDQNPSEWAKFSHSSSFDDAKAGVKALFHKYIIRALASSTSMRDDIVIATPSSTWDKVKLKKVPENDIPRMLKFSVTRGIRTAYEPLINPAGEIVKVDDKEVYREIKTSESNFTTIVSEIYGLVFADEEKNPQDVALFHSFKGICELIKKKTSKQVQKDILFRMEQLLWDEKMGQELEVGDPKTDYEVKIAGYNYLLKELGLKMDPKTEKMIDTYYKGYGKRKSFISEGMTFAQYIKEINSEKILNEMASVRGTEEYSSHNKKYEWDQLKGTQFIKLIKKNINSTHHLYSTIQEKTFFLTNDNMDYLGSLEVETVGSKYKVAKILASNSGIKSGFYLVMFTAILTFTDIDEILSGLKISQNAYNSYEKLTGDYQALKVSVILNGEELEFNRENVIKTGARISVTFRKNTGFNDADRKDFLHSYSRFYENFKLNQRKVKDFGYPLDYLSNLSIGDEQRFIYSENIHYVEDWRNI